MGIFGSSVSGIKSFASAAVSGIKSVCSAVSGFAGRAITALGQLIGGKAVGFMGLVGGLVSGPLGPILGPVIAKLIVDVVVKVIEKLAKIFGIIKEEDKTEDLGYRIEEANREENRDWKKKEDFASLAEYYAYLKEQIPDDKLDMERLRRNRDYYAVLGMIAETTALEEKLRIGLPDTFLFEAGRSRMTPDEIRAFADAFRMLGYESVDVRDYFKGKMAPGEAKRITEAIIESLKTYCKDKTEAELYARLGEMQAVARDDTKLQEVYKSELEETDKKGQIPEMHEV